MKAYIPPELTAAFPPSSDSLLEVVRRKTDDMMLMEIARADYGHEADECFAALRPIRDNGIIPPTMNAVLDEAFTLTRWCDPEKPNPPPFEPGPTGRRGHQTRLFACAVLLRYRYDEPAHDSTLANGLASAKVIGEAESEALARFVMWRYSRNECQDFPVLISLALLLLATRLRASRFSEPQLGRIADWVIEEEAYYRRPNSQGLESPPMEFSLLQEFWHPLNVELKSEAAMIQDEDVRTKLQLCSLLIDRSWDA